jgi:hypothetical protein
MKQLSEICLDIASGAFLCNTMPTNWDEMSEEDRDSWLEANRFEPFESTSPGELYSLMEDHGRILESRLNEFIRNAEECLVNAAAEDQLPLNFQELNLKALMGLE